jgi:hypothetical protein
MRAIIQKLFVAVFLSTLAWAQGTVTGTALDETGKPLAKAKVRVAEKGPFGGHRTIQYYETDSEGHFLIGHVPWGTYVVVGGKEGAGYPDTNFAFYSNLAVPTVTLSPDSPTANVDLKFGPKAGILEVAPVADAETGKEIRSASITLRRAGSDFFMTASTTEGRILVPSATEVLVRITAPGYKPWPPTDQPTAKGTILLQPEEVLKLQIALHREESTPDQKPER